MDTMAEPLKDTAENTYSYDLTDDVLEEPKYGLKRSDTTEMI